MALIMNINTGQGQLANRDDQPQGNQNQQTMAASVSNQGAPAETQTVFQENHAFLAVPVKKKKASKKKIQLQNGFVVGLPAPEFLKFPGRVPKANPELKDKEYSLALAPVGCHPFAENDCYGKVGYEDMTVDEDITRFELPVFPDEDPNDAYCRNLKNLRDIVAEKVPGGKERLNLKIALKNWPNVPKLVTYAPGVFSDAFQREEKVVNSNVNKDVPLFNLPPEITSKILGEIDFHRGLANLSQTSVKAFQIVADHTIHWDLDTGNFPTDSLHGSRCERVISIARGRGTEELSSREYLKNTFRCLEVLMKHAEPVQVLHLHEVDFLNTDFVRCIMANCPNLRFLGIYQCRQLDLFKIDELYGYAAEVVAVRREKGNKTRLYLDFGPMYFSGPNTYKREGSYGIFHNNPGFNPAAGVLQAVLAAQKYADEMNFDVLEPASALRHFLKRAPLPKNFTENTHASLIQYDRRVMEAAEEKGEIQRKNLLEKAEGHYHDDALTTIFGGEHAPVEVPRAVLCRLVRECNPELYNIQNQDRLWQWWRRLAKCNVCLKDMRWWNLPFAKGTCWSCNCKLHIEQHEDSQLRAYFTLASQKIVAQANRTAFEEERLPTLADVLIDGMDPEYIGRVRYAAVIDMVREHDLHAPQNGSTDLSRRLNPRCYNIVHRFRKTMQPHDPLDRIRCDQQYSHPANYRIRMSESFLTAPLAKDLENEYGTYRLALQDDKDRDSIHWIRNQMMDLTAAPNPHPNGCCWDFIQLCCAKTLADKIADARRTGDVEYPEYDITLPEYRYSTEEVEPEILREALGTTHPRKALLKAKETMHWDIVR